MYRGFKCSCFRLVKCSSFIGVDDWDGRLIGNYRYSLELETLESVIIPDGHIGLLKPSNALYGLSYLGFDLSRVDYLLSGERVISYVVGIPNIVEGFGRLEVGDASDYGDLVRIRLDGLGFREMVLLDLLVFRSL